MGLFQKIGSALGSPAGAVGAQLAGTGGNIISTILTNKANKKMAQYQYTKDLEMWQKANEYNSPTAQMARLKQAGINPNMVFGGGAVSGNTVQSSMPHYQAPRLEAPRVDMNPALSSMVMSRNQDIALKAETINQTKAVTEGKLLENEFLASTMQSKIQRFLWNAKSDQERAVGLGILNNMNLLKYKFDQDTYGTRTAQALANYNNTVSQIQNRSFMQGIAKANLNINEKKLLMNQQLLPWQIQEMVGNVGLKRQLQTTRGMEQERYKIGTDKAPWWVNTINQGYHNLKNWWNKPKTSGGSW